MRTISVRGATEHNLRDVSVDIPKKRLVAFTGVSGSGKSSLVFDTLYVEAFRRFADASHAPVHLMGHSMWARTSRPRFRSITGLPPALGLSQRQGVAGKLSTVGTICGASDLLRVYFAAFGDVSCKNCDIPLRATTFQQVMDRVQTVWVGKKINVVAPIVEKRKGAFVNEIEKFRELGFSKVRVNGKLHSLQDDDDEIRIDAKKLNTIEVLIDFLAVEPAKAKRLERAVLQALEYGKGVLKVEEGLDGKGSEEKFNTCSACPQCGESAPRLDPRHFSHSSLGQCVQCGGAGASDDDLPADLFPCATCAGTRLTNDKPIVRVAGRTFEQAHELALPHLLRWVEADVAPASRGDRSRERVSSELLRLLSTMDRMGLDHLCLSRSGSSLSPGDLQRLRLSAMLSNRLTGALYVLDEPCQGLTSSEVDKLHGVLRRLVDHGASVVVVEHHPAFLRQCDDIYVMGPGAGAKGGHIVGQAAIADYEKEHQGLARASRAASAAKNIASGDGIVFADVAVRNLTRKEIFVPQGAVTILRGPAGRGKATFVELCLLPALEHFLAKPKPLNHSFFSARTRGEASVTHVNDVRPGSLTRTSRRSVAAALEVIVPLRELYAQLPQSQIMGLTESHFSWYSKLGRCTACEGRGYIELMQRYGPPVEVQCETCVGARLSSRSLLPRFKGHNLAEVMQMSIDEALGVFGHVKLIESRLSRAAQFGLGYVKLGQGMDSLSGGELQRLTLTIELKRSQLAGSWFLLVHPGTGLHSPDIRVLGDLMRMMKERGATFFVLENREEFFTYADHVIEF
jgi:excinuclease ABC subunit A